MPTTEIDDQVVTFTCHECGEEWGDEFDAAECCTIFDCENCGREWSSEGEADDCCQHECARCGCLYHYEDDAADCCRGATLESYSYKPAPVFHAIVDGLTLANTTRPTDEPYMGFELEMEGGNSDWSEAEAVARIHAALGELVYCKEDGSLSYGLEMVSHPGTIEFWRQVNWSILERLAKSGHRAWDTNTAGLHVHLGIDAFKSRAHFARFYMLFQRNSDWWIKFAGRHSDYALYDVDERIYGRAVSRAVKYFPFKSTVLDSVPTVDYTTKTTWKQRARQEDARYQVLEQLEKTHATVIKDPDSGIRGAVNCLNQRTVEVRLFRPSLKYTTLLACLEAVHAAWAYTKGLAIKDKAEAYSKGDLLSGGAFARWVQANKVAYPYLDARITTRLSGLVNEEDRRY